MAAGGPATSRLVLPRGENDVELTVGRKRVRLTHLEKILWTDLGITKRDLLQYYADVAPVLLPHLKNRAILMKRVPTPRPHWIRTCSVEDASGRIIDLPIVQDLASLLWVVDLDCIDLNPWCARCDDVHRPDYLHFDLDPVPGSEFEEVLRTALRMKENLDAHHIPSYPKTSGLRGMHIYVPIKRALVQTEVWALAKDLAKKIPAEIPERGRVGRPLASVYSVRPTPRATVSAPVTWEEVARGFRVDDFRIDNMAQRVREVGDLWKPLTMARGRVDVERMV